MVKPVTLYFDIETLPMIVTDVYELGRQDINYKQILKEVQVACIGYAFDNEPPAVLHMDYKAYDMWTRDDEADRKMITEFRALVERADLAVGHNLKAFDVGILRARMMKFQVPDFKPFLIDDTYQSTKEIRFTSHKLDYLAPYLLGERYRKKEHPAEMWRGVMTHAPGSFQRMITYCAHDVALTRRTYKHIRPYIKSSLNLAVFRRDKRVCPNCGTRNTMQSRGYRYTQTGAFKVYYCKSCQTYPSVGTNEIKRSGDMPR